MRTPVLALLVALFASPADAQFGRVLDRARETVEDAVRDRAPEPPPQEAAAPRPVTAQTTAAPNRPLRTGPAPAADAYDLLFHAAPTAETGVAGGTGPFAVLFPTDGTYELAVVDAAGATVASTSATAAPIDRLPTFAVLRYLLLDYEPTPGDYELVLRLDGAPLTAIPYTLSRIEGDDPFNPTTTWEVDGPWASYGVLRAPTDDADGDVELTYWVRPNEVSGDRVEVRPVLFRDGQRVSAYEDGSMVFASHQGWTAHRTAIDVDNGGRRGPLRRDALVDGDYRIEVGEEGRPPIRVFHFSVSGGQFVPHERSALEYEPRAGFLTPRSVADEAYGRNRFSMVDQVWMVSE